MTNGGGVRQTALVKNAASLAWQHHDALATATLLCCPVSDPSGPGSWRLRGTWTVGAALQCQISIQLIEQIITAGWTDWSGLSTLIFIIVGSTQQQL